MTAELTYLVNRSAAGKYSRRAFLGRAGALGLTAVMAQSMLATAARAQGPVKGGHLKIGLHGGDFSNKIDSARAVAPVPLFNLRCLGDTLVELGTSGDLVPRLAEEFSANADASVWTLRIRRDVIFHDGSQMGPEDVKATLDRHRDPATQSVIASHLAHISEISTDGDLVVVRLETPDIEFPFALTDPRLSIQPKFAQGSPIFTGGYSLKVNEPGVRHLFERHAQYWDDSRAHVAQIEVLVINDPQLRLANLTTGQVHMISRVDPRRSAELGAHEGLTLVRSPGAHAPAFVMQASARPYGSAELRLALKHAIDRQSILADVFGGMGELGNDLPLNGASVQGFSGIDQRQYDPDRAAWHFRNAMHDGSPIILRVSDMAYLGAYEAAKSFQATANAANIPLEIRREEVDSYWPEVWNRQPFAASLMGPAATTGLALSAFGSKSSCNETRFSNERYDELLLASRREGDLTLRTEMQSEMARIITSDGGLILPAFADALDLHSAEVQGFEGDARGELMGGFAGVKTWLA